MHFIRVVLSAAKYNFISFYRVFRISSFALRFFMPLLSIGTAWVLYNRIFHGQVHSEFGMFSNTDYLTFVIIGNAVFAYIYACVFFTGRVLYFCRLEGVIDPLLLTPMSRLAFMIGSALMGMLNATFDFILLIALGVVLAIDLSSLNSSVFFSGILITLVPLFGLGLVVNGITLSLRDRVNTANFLQMILYTFSGIVVPVEMMPEWAQMISKISPLTYGLRIIRGSLRPGIALSNFSKEILILLIMGVMLFSVGVYFLGIIESNLKKYAKLTVF